MALASVRKLVSGGQSGVDRAALDFALEVQLECGGWCPRGRKAEDGPIPERYPLAATPGESYSQRTEWNVRDSDGTLVLTRGEPCGGTRLTIDFAKPLQRPCLVVDLDRADIAGVLEWLQRQDIGILNVAGPRESQRTGIDAQAKTFLWQAWHWSVDGKPDFEPQLPPVPGV